MKIIIEQQYIPISHEHLISYRQRHGAATRQVLRLQFLQIQKKEINFSGLWISAKNQHASMTKHTGLHSCVIIF